MRNNNPRSFNNLTTGSPRDRKSGGGTPGSPLVTGNRDIVVTLQPMDNTVSEAANSATFFILAEARPVELSNSISYQWFVNGEEIASDNADWSGANTANLALVDNLLTYADGADPGLLYVVMSTNDRTFYRSQAANLIVATANITISPDAANLTIARGGAFFINVGATTDASPSVILDYSWTFANGTALVANATLSGVTSNQLHITDTGYQVSSNLTPNYFYCVITTPGGGTKNTANATVFSVNVDTIPVACSVSAPAAATFTLAANCRPAGTLAYSWKFGNAQTVVANSLFSGVSSNTLVLSDSTGWTGNTFYCSISVTGATGTVNTTPVALTVA